MITSPRHFRIISYAKYRVPVSIVSMICRHFVTKLQELHKLCLKEVKNSLVASLYKNPWNHIFFQSFSSLVNLIASTTFHLIHSL